MQPETKVIHTAIKSEQQALSVLIIDTDLNGLQTAEQQIKFFKTHQAKCRFLERIAAMVALYDGWDIINLTEILNTLEHFRAEASTVQIPYLKPITIPDTDEIIYKKFQTGYYNTNHIGIDNMGYRGRQAYVYSEYFLLYDFINEKIHELYSNNPFSKFAPLRQADEVLKAVRENDTAHGLPPNEIFMILKNKGHLIPFRLLSQILSHMRADKLITLNNNNALLTFEGRLFIGYENQKNLNSEKVQIENARTKSLIWATWFAGIGALGVVAIEILKRIRSYYPKEQWSSFLVLVFGIVLGAIIPTIILATQAKNNK